MRRTGRTEIDRFLRDFLATHTGIEARLCGGELVLSAGSNRFARRTSGRLLYLAEPRGEVVRDRWVSVGPIRTPRDRAAATLSLERAARAAAYRGFLPAGDE